MAWTSSRRKQRRGMTGWQEQAMHRRVMARHHGTCHICGKPGADIIDDVIPLAEGGKPTEANKRPAHSEPCHRLKTQAEAARARARQSARRPTEPHPGRVDP